MQGGPTAQETLAYKPAVSYFAFKQRGKSGLWASELFPNVARRRPTESFGRQRLVTRRLAEAGARFIELFHGNWDHHTSLVSVLPSRCEETDLPIAALLNDLDQRGLLKDTLVIWGGQFGRTPTEGGNFNGKTGGGHAVPSNHLCRCDRPRVDACDLELRTPKERCVTSAAPDTANPPTALRSQTSGSENGSRPDCLPSA